MNNTDSILGLKVYDVILLGEDFAKNHTEFDAKVISLDVHRPTLETDCPLYLALEDGSYLQINWHNCSITKAVEIPYLKLDTALHYGLDVEVCSVSFLFEPIIDHAISEIIYYPDEASNQIVFENGMRITTYDYLGEFLRIYLT